MVSAVLERPTTGDLLEIEDLTRREFLAGAVVAALLVACGGDDEEPTPAPETRDVEGMFGTVAVPESLQRVIVDNNTALGNMLALERKPIAASVNTNSLPHYLLDGVEGVEDVTAEEGGIDVEKALALNPDLIIAFGGIRDNPFNQENCEIYAQAVATFCYEQNYVYEEDIKANVEAVGRALDEEQKAREVIARFNKRVAELSEKVKEAGFDSKTVSVLRVFANGNFSLRFGTSESIIFRAIGIPQPEGQQNPEDFALAVSTENVRILNDAWALVIYVDSNSEETPETLLREEIWTTVTPIEENRVVFVDAGVWNSIDILGAMEIMNDIEEKLLPLAE